MDYLAELGASLPDSDQSDHNPSTSLPACTSPRVAPTVRQRNFTAQTHDAALHFQILDLGRQYFVWVSAVGPKMGNLHLAIKTPADTAPAVASLLQGSTAGGEGSAMAQRLALKLGAPVVCSVNMPPNSPLLQAIAERRLLQELQAMRAEAEQGKEEQGEQAQGQQGQGGQQRSQPGTEGTQGRADEPGQQEEGRRGDGSGANGFGG